MDHSLLVLEHAICMLVAERATTQTLGQKSQAQFYVKKRAKGSSYLSLLFFVGNGFKKVFNSVFVFLFAAFGPDFAKSKLMIASFGQLPIPIPLNLVVAGSGGGGPWV